MNEEILQVLEMVKSGKITPEEGEKLIAAIHPPEKQFLAKASKSMLRIRVDATDPDIENQAKVNVNIPLSVAKKAAGLLSLVPKDVKTDLNDKGINLDAIDLKGLIEMFENGELAEELVNVEAGTPEKGAVVRIYVD